VVEKARLLAAREVREIERDGDEFAYARCPPGLIDELCTSLAAHGTPNLHLLLVVKRQQIDARPAERNVEGLPARGNDKTEFRQFSLEGRDLHARAFACGGIQFVPAVKK